MHFPETFYDFIRNNTLIEIKGGTTRDTFLSIWIVEVNNRLFVRSWNKNPRSWFSAFLQTGVGQLKYGAHILHVSAKKTPETDPVHSLINAAYLGKYNQEGNKTYAEGITQPEYADYTLELFFESIAV